MKYQHSSQRSKIKPVNIFRFNKIVNEIIYRVDIKLKHGLLKVLFISILGIVFLILTVMHGDDVKVLYSITNIINIFNLIYIVLLRTNYGAARHKVELALNKYGIDRYNIIELVNGDITVNVQKDGSIVFKKVTGGAENEV